MKHVDLRMTLVLLYFVALPFYLTSKVHGFTGPYVVDWFAVFIVNLAAFFFFYQAYLGIMMILLSVVFTDTDFEFGTGKAKVLRRIEPVKYKYFIWGSYAVLYNLTIYFM